MNEPHGRLDPRIKPLITRLVNQAKEQVMAAIDDLNSAVASVQSEQKALAGGVTNVVALVGQLQAQVTALQGQVGAGVDPAAVESAVAELQSTTAALTDSATALQGALPAPAPTPGA